MTNPHPHRLPTDRQLRYLRWLSEQTGTSFSPPATFAEADAEIDRMTKLEKSDPDERRREIRDVKNQLARRSRSRLSLLAMRRAAQRRRPARTQVWRSHDGRQRP